MMETHAHSTDWDEDLCQWMLNDPTPSSKNFIISPSIDVRVGKELLCLALVSFQPDLIFYFPPYPSLLRLIFSASLSRFLSFLLSCGDPHFLQEDGDLDPFN